MVYATHVADDPARLEETLSNCRSDVLVTCGGVSVGDHDYVKTALAKLGEIYFWKVAIKPGKPFVFGRLKSRTSFPAAAGGESTLGALPMTAGDDGGPWVFGLPGNPVSSLVALDVLVRPALRALAGQETFSKALHEAVLSRPVGHKPGRREFVRAQVHRNGRGWIAEPVRWQGSGMLRSLTEANAYVVVPEESEGLAEGSRVHVLMRGSE